MHTFEKYANNAAITYSHKTNMPIYRQTAVTYSTYIQVC